MKRAKTAPFQDQYRVPVLFPRLYFMLSTGINSSDNLLFTFLKIRRAGYPVPPGKNGEFGTDLVTSMENFNTFRFEFIDGFLQLRGFHSKMP